MGQMKLTMSPGCPAEIVVPQNSLEDLFGASIRGIEQACKRHQEELEMELRWVCPLIYY